MPLSIDRHGGGVRKPPEQPPGGDPQANPHIRLLPSRRFFYAIAFSGETVGSLVVLAFWTVAGVSGGRLGVSFHVDGEDAVGNRAVESSPGGSRSGSLSAGGRSRVFRELVGSGKRGDRRGRTFGWKRGGGWLGRFLEERGRTCPIA